ncbi:EAL domain-containing protein [Desulfofalx alkaliphila]|uniref:EAL domain-containing protein n=1 Tax=Desulfofalx alkaliphila TaxID=105483 RepID=UPI0004E21554|nr:EAL domain-containing protein [Desulfofalx alkaliphila]
MLRLPQFKAIRWRFIFYITLVVFLGQVVTFIWTANKIKEDANLSALENIKNQMALAEALLDSIHPGEWQIRHDMLYKGDTLMNGNYQVIDLVGRLTGNTMTIFRKDIRVATNLVREGERAIGTTISPEVAQVVLEEGNSYFGEADVVGVKYQTVYKPIKNAKGEVIGILYMGANKQFIDNMIMNAYWTTMFTFSLALLGMILVIWLLTNKLTRPIEELVEAANSIARGDMKNKIRVTSSDEIGKLACSFDKMRVKLQKQYDKLQKTNEMLQESERRFRDMLENVQLIAVILDKNNNITFCNDYLLRITGWKQEEVIGQNWTDLFMPEEHKNGSGEGVQANQVTYKPQVIKEIITKSGQRLLIQWHITVIKDLNGNIMGSARIGEDVTERRKYEEKIEYLATHDSLTNIPNRYYLEEELKNVISRAKPDNMGALLFIDVDNFKLINDTLGHDAGDTVLVALVNSLKIHLQDGDFIARLGGDEFAVLLKRASHEEATRLAEQMRLAIDESGLCTTAYHSCFNVSISIGIVMIDGRLDSQKVLSYADSALHRAKEEGKNRIILIDNKEDPISIFAETNEIINMIKIALRDNKFQLYFQPVVRAKDNKVIYYEVLIRMRNGDGNLIPPSKFIPIAEHFNLMPQIDRWVVDYGLRVLQEYPNIKLFFNLSGVSMGDEDLLDHIEAAIINSGTDASRIGFEITETAAVKNLIMAEKWINKLKSLGCQFALDDFGIGFSSLSYLSMLSVDYLKIDGSFVRKITKEASAATLIQAINTAAHAMNKKTIAECVENKKELDKLKGMGVDYMQGFYYDKPSPIPLEVR